MESHQPRILVLGETVRHSQLVIDALSQFYVVDVVGNMDHVPSAMLDEMYDAVLADVGEFQSFGRGLGGEEAHLVLNTIGEGVCVIDADGRMSWSNQRMRSFAPPVIENVKQICCQARHIFDAQISHGSDTASIRSKKFTFQVDTHYFELMTSPVLDEVSGDIRQVVAVVWDASGGRRWQQKLDAIDAAGRELASIEREAISKLTPGERLKLLEDKIIRYSKDLMHFDHFAIRLLDKRSNKLDVVIAEALPFESLEVDLYAESEGNGISGYVAATGRSYICHDVEKDSRYVLGLTHGKSALTVPLRLFDKVVGVYNIESESIGAFGEDDRQFAEIFGRYVALALHILDLLVVERYTISDQITHSVAHEITQPLNKIVTAAQTLVEEYIGDDTMRGRLNAIMDHVESIRTSIRNVVAGPKTVIGYDDQAEADSSESLLTGKQVLIADDESNIRKSINQILIKHGCICDVCKDGYEATTMIEQKRFDLIISDIKMPYRNGYEIFATARRIHDQVPVLLMTGFGYDPHHSIVRASQDGLSGVLFKPFKVEQLIEEVQKALGMPTPPPTSSLSDQSPSSPVTKPSGNAS